MIRLSLQPSPASETSAFNNIRAFNNLFAGLFPFLIIASSCSRSSAYRVLDSCVLHFNVAGFAEAFIKSNRIAHIGMGRLTANDFDDAPGQRERLVAGVSPDAYIPNGLKWENTYAYGKLQLSNGPNSPIEGFRSA